MEIEIDTNHLLAVVLLIVVGVIAFMYLNQPPATSEYQFVFYGDLSDANQTVRALFNAERVAILMDGRYANTSLAREVYNCGALYARDLGRLGKNVSNYAVEYDYCVLPNLNKTTLEECNSILNSQSDFVLYIRPAFNGSGNVSFYSNWMEVYVPMGGANQCGIRAA